ncbi:MAG: hypothetical protein J7L55_04500 [Desulfurococcales archaeon]|nr:hypothetical protein [Desulfurococcales archaeon]
MVLSSPVRLTPRAISIATLTAWALSGAGTMSSALAKTVPQTPRSEGKLRE